MRPCCVNTAAVVAVHDSFMTHNALPRAPEPFLYLHIRHVLSLLPAVTRTERVTTGPIGWALVSGTGQIPKTDYAYSAYENVDYVTELVKDFITIVHLRLHRLNLILRQR